MPQSLSKIYLHIIFHIKTTSPEVSETHLPRMFQYVAQLVKADGCFVIKVGGTGNHIHALVSLGKTETVAHLVEEMKRNSSRWIKTCSPLYEHFEWQGGYAAFSVSQSQIDTLTTYIDNQVEHHRKQSFRDEYLSFLKLYKIEYNEKYVLSD